MYIYVYIYIYIQDRRKVFYGEGRGGLSKKSATIMTKN